MYLSLLRNKFRVCVCVYFHEHISRTDRPLMYPTPACGFVVSGKCGFDINPRLEFEDETKASLPDLGADCKSLHLSAPFSLVPGLSETTAVTLVGF